MHKILFTIPICLLMIAGCGERDLETSLDHTTQVGLHEKMEIGRSFAGEIDAEKSYRSEIEEKIIKTAYASIKTNRVEEAYDKALKLVKKYDAIILNASMSKYDDTEEAQLLIKIPPVHFMTLLDELNTIGKVESKSITEEDVTEEYYDVKARLVNARKVQDRLFGILKKANKVEDILKVEKEIERVGEKIEILEGKIRYFDSKVDYSRITVTIYSRKAKFIDLSGIGRDFANAIKYAIHFFFIIIWFIIIIIPLIVIILVLRPVIAYIIGRIKRKKSK
ncbi:MAG: DUF4349 domain-containing protein [bacterium]